MDVGSSFPEVKRPGREADHSPPSSAEVKNACSYISTPQYAFMAWCIIKQCIRLHDVVLSLVQGIILPQLSPEIVSLSHAGTWVCVIVILCHEIAMGRSCALGILINFKQIKCSINLYTDNSSIIKKEKVKDRVSRSVFLVFFMPDHHWFCH
jgi:hypothetical protein